MKKYSPSESNNQRVILPEGLIYPDFNDEYTEKRMSKKLKSRFNIDRETEFILPSLVALRSYERPMHEQLSHIDKKFKPRVHIPLVTVQEVPIKDSLAIRPTYKTRNLVPEWITFDEAFTYLDKEDEATQKLINTKTGEIPGMQRRAITRFVLEEAREYLFGEETTDLG